MYKDLAPIRVAGNLVFGKLTSVAEEVWKQDGLVAATDDDDGSNAAFLETLRQLFHLIDRDHLQQQQLASTSKEEYDALQAQIKGLEEDLNEVEAVRGKEEAGLEADYEEVDMTRDQQVKQLESELNDRMLHKRKAKDDLDFEGTIHNGCNSVACPAGYRSTKASLNCFVSFYNYVH